MKNIYKVNEEAVKKIAERVYDNGSTVINRNDLEEMFPELKKESEDEKIRKAVIDAVETLSDSPLKIKMLAWLEKQGEHANFRNKIQIGDKVTRNRDGMLVNLSQLNRVAKKDEKQVEQKPVPDWMPTFLDELRSKKNYFDWDEHKDIEGGILAIINWMNPNYFNEKDGKQKPTDWPEKYIADVFEMVGLAKIVREQGNDALTEALQSAMIELAKYSVVPQPKQEWSEEDKKKLNLALYFLNESKQNAPEEFETYGKRLSKKDYEDVVNWLKSLRPQSQWKPSKGQIMALRWVLNNVPYNKHKEEISGLLEQIKNFV